MNRREAVKTLIAGLIFGVVQKKQEYLNFGPPRFRVLDGQWITTTTVYHEYGVRYVYWRGPETNGEVIGMRDIISPDDTTFWYDEDAHPQIIHEICTGCVHI